MQRKETVLLYLNKSSSQETIISINREAKTPKDFFNLALAFYLRDDSVFTHYKVLKHPIELSKNTQIIDYQVAYDLLKIVADQENSFSSSSKQLMKMIKRSIMGALKNQFKCSVIADEEIANNFKVNKLTEQFILKKISIFDLRKKINEIDNEISDLAKDILSLTKISNSSLDIKNLETEMKMCYTQKARCCIAYRKCIEEEKVLYTELNDSINCLKKPYPFSSQEIFQLAKSKKDPHEIINLCESALHKRKSEAAHRTEEANIEAFKIHLLSNKVKDPEYKFDLAKFDDETLCIIKSIQKFSSHYELARREFSGFTKGFHKGFTDYHDVFYQITNQLKEDDNKFYTEVSAYRERRTGKTCSSSIRATP